MDTLPKLLWHIALGAVLLNLCLLFARQVGSSYGKKSAPKLIKPFQVSGGSENAAKRGESLAHLLNGRLARISREMAAAQSSLDAAERTPSKMMAVEGKEDLIRPFDLSGGVFNPLDLKMTVGTVEVGGLLSWLHGWMATDSALAISVVETGEKSVAAGVIRGERDEPLWLEGKAGEDIQLVTDLAYLIAQNRYRESHPEVEFLKASDFGKLLAGLNAVAKLSLQAKITGVSEAKYRENYDLLEPLLRAELANWRPLVHVVAELAERSGQRDQALALYKQEQGLLDPASADDLKLLPNLLRKIETLEKPPLGGADPSVAKVTSQPEVAAAREKLHSLIGLPHVPLSDDRRARIGIVGPPPTPGVLPDDVPVKVISTRTRAGTDSALVSHIDNLTSTIRLVIPHVEFVVADLDSRSGTFRDGDSLRALDALLGEEVPPAVILYPYSSPKGDALPSIVVERLRSDRILYVLPAGNFATAEETAVPFPESSPLRAGTDLRKQFAVAGAVDWNGKPTDFSNRDTEVLWAPGVEIGSLNRHSGTSFSAAITAGVAAWIKAIHPTISSEELVTVLQETSQPKGSPEVKVINLQAALERLATRP